MNGVHDMGGMQGFGPIHPEADEPVFHADWERLALGLTLAMGATGQWNIDQSRSARESLPPAQYLGSSYYAIWLAALKRLMLQRRLVTAEELDLGRSLHVPAVVARVLRADEVAAALAKGTSTERGTSAAAVFAQGDQVRARNVHPQGHSRLPRYVRGHVGTVVTVQGCHVFADAHAANPGAAPWNESPQWLYTVQFTGTELWGTSAEPGTHVSVEAWEPMLEAV